METTAANEEEEDTAEQLLKADADGLIRHKKPTQEQKKATFLKQR